MNRALILSLSLAFVASCGGSKSDPAPSCTTGLTLCGSVCVDLQLDDAHCGTCDIACAGDRSCAAGVCEISCGAGHAVCGDVCIAYLTDSNNCGGCAPPIGTGKVCAVDFGADYACEVGKCEIQCAAPATRCGSETAGVCADLATDEAHCGTCTTTCDAGKVCELGVCEITCPTGQIRCGSGATATCVDPATDEGHCGNCTVACDAGALCRYGLCTTTSPACRGLLLPGAPLTPSTAHPIAVGAGNFDADTFTDLVVVDDDPITGGRLYRLKGRGDGTFDPPAYIENFTSPSALLVGFFDGDAIPDVIVASSGAGVTTLQPLFGDGVGGFLAATDSALDAGASPQAIALVDLNMDFRPDLVVGDGAAQATSNLRIFLNDGTGLFGNAGGLGLPRTASQTFSVGLDVRGVGGGDVNADISTCPGCPDVVVVWNDTTTFEGEVLIGNGLGTLTRPSMNTHKFHLGEPAPTGLVVGDLNDDGFADWIVAHAASNALTIGISSIDAGKPPPVGLQQILSDVAEPRALILTELDGDFLPELITANASAGALYYHHNSGPSLGGVVFDPPVALPVGLRPVATTLAPVALSGADFLFTLDEGTDDVASTEALGLGAFGAPVRYAAAAGTSAIALGDVDGDALLDLATANFADDLVTVRLQILLGGSGGSFGAPSATISLPDLSAPVSMVAGALDSDANVDLAIALEGTAQVAFLWGNGAGGFAAPQYVAVGSEPEQVIVANVNGDAYLDLVTADMGSSQLTLLLNQGTRSFVTSTLPVGAGPRAVAALQLGAAVCKSLVSANATAGTLTVHPCDPSSPGEFLTAIDVAACAGARSLAVADFDADGVPDLAVACDAGVAVFHSPGTGSLEGGALFDAGGPVRSVSSADVNADGWMDLIVSVAGSGGVTVLHGAAAMGFSPPSVYPVGGDPLETATADLDGDSRTDVCAAVENPLGAVLGAGAAVLFSRCLP